MSWSDWSKEPALTYDIQGQVVPAEEKPEFPQGSFDISISHKNEWTGSEYPTFQLQQNAPTTTETIPASAPSAGVEVKPMVVPEVVVVEEIPSHTTTMEGIAQ